MDNGLQIRKGQMWEGIWTLAAAAAAFSAFFFSASFAFSSFLSAFLDRGCPGNISQRYKCGNIRTNHEGRNHTFGLSRKSCAGAVRQTSWQEATRQRYGTDRFSGHSRRCELRNYRTMQIFLHARPGILRTAVLT